MPEPTFDLLAASLRADTSDTRVMVEALASKLEDALPAHTTVERKAAKLFSKEKRARRVSVRLGNDTYTLSIEGELARGHHATTVRGIVIRSEELSLDAWIAALGRALHDEAERSEATRTALDRLLA